MKFTQMFALVFLFVAAFFLGSSCSRAPQSVNENAPLASARTP